MKITLKKEIWGGEIRYSIYLNNSFIRFLEAKSQHEAIVEYDKYKYDKMLEIANPSEIIKEDKI